METNNFNNNFNYVQSQDESASMSRTFMANVFSWMAAALIFTGYSGMVLWLSSWALGRAISMPWIVTTLFGANFMLLVWRLLFRAYFTTLQYGWREGACSVPRLFVGNVIAVMAASRALFGYIQILFTGHVVWDKTSHIFAFEPKSQYP